MPFEQLDAFHWLATDVLSAGNTEQLTPAEKYNRLVAWAGQARGRNPNAFDALTEWIRDDAEWGDDQLAANEQVLMRGVLGRFRAQNARLRAYLKELEPSGVVNPPVFGALERFDEALAGDVPEQRLRAAAARVLADFSAMRERGVRQLIAGNVTGPTGTNGVELFGYINHLKDCDAGVQWALFMPGVVERQQKGFQVAGFEYKQMPALRFIGREDSGLEDMERRRELFATLDSLSAYRSGFDYDLFFMHHYGLTVDVGPWHGYWGRFMQAGTPVPEGFLAFDLAAEDNGLPGPPYLAQFAFATFTGDTAAMHVREGYDSDAMYDVTRNILLARGVNIPYPDKYWVAEVFLNGCEQPGSAYLFSIKL